VTAPGGVNPTVFDHSAEAVIERGCIVIRVPIVALADAVAGGCDAGYVEPPIIVLDAELFALDVVRALNQEDSEDGTSPVHHLFDTAFERAFEAGAQGVEEARRCDYCGQVVAKVDARSNDGGEIMCIDCIDEAEEEEEDVDGLDVPEDETGGAT
jgi:hypothetical protein